MVAHERLTDLLSKFKGFWNLNEMIWIQTFLEFKLLFSISKDLNLKVAYSSYFFQINSYKTHIVDDVLSGWDNILYKNMNVCFRDMYGSKTNWNNAIC